jgi:uncharacterized RDD family membrane protein YckC
MKQILRWAMTGALLAGLCACIAPAAAHDTRRVEVGSTGIDIRGGGGHVVIGNGGIRITDHSKSIVIAKQQSRCPSGQEIVEVGHNARLPAGRAACDVVTVFGNSSVHGTVSDSVVAVMGRTRVDGNVANSVVTVFGNGHINGSVGGNVVTIFGNLRLGPKAIVQGQTVSLFGSYERNPSAVVQGGTVRLMSGIFHFTDALQGWGEHCLLFGRLLAPRLDVLWAWGVALGLLAIYLLVAALFRDGLRHCVRTLEEHPGPSILTALAMVLLTPILMLVLMVALTVTVVGIIFVPLLWIGLLCAGIFGRVVTLAWLGGRILRGAHRGVDQPVLHVLVGGVLVSVLYMVPVVGFIVFAVIGLIGFGTLTYTLLLALRSARGAVPPPQPAEPPGTAGAAPGPGAAAADATSETAAMSAGPIPGATASAAPAEPTPLELMALPRAGFWIRMAALLIDLVLISVCLSLIGHHDSDGTLIALAAYGAIMWKLRGTTVGGIICHLRVARIDGRPLNWETAILRALGCFLSLVAAGLGFFWIAFDAERQAWHDKIAGTVVVSVPKVRGLV